MAFSVFGNPITDLTLRRMPGYEITRKDRAHVALKMKNAENKAVHAHKYVEELKDHWGMGVSTLCLVYNATGDTLKFVTRHDYYGQLGHLEQAPFPEEIANGQWGGFLHGKTTLAFAGSSAAVVYRGKNQVGDDCDWMLAWSNPLNKVSYTNKAYTEIREAHDYGKEDFWGTIADKTEQSGLNCFHEWNGCVSEVSIGDGTSPMFEAVMTLKKDDA